MSETQNNNGKTIIIRRWNMDIDDLNNVSDDELEKIVTQLDDMDDEELEYMGDEELDDEEISDEELVDDEEVDEELKDYL